MNIKTNLRIHFFKINIYYIVLLLTVSSTILYSNTITVNNYLTKTLTNNKIIKDTIVELIVNTSNDLPFIIAPYYLQNKSKILIINETYLINNQLFIKPFIKENRKSKTVKPNPKAIYTQCMYTLNNNKCCYTIGGVVGLQGCIPIPNNKVKLTINIKFKK